MAINRQDYENIMDTASRRVPFWARSSNPIVRRHLGFNWRTVPPEIRPLLKAVLVWAGIFAVGAIFPPLQDFAVILVIAAIILMPVIFLIYVRVLFNVAVISTDTMQEEMRNNTFSLLRATPMTLEQIFLGKIAAAMWRYMDDLMLVAQATVLLSPPILLVTYMAFWDLITQPIMLRSMIIVGLMVSLMRIVLEPVMIGLIAVFMGLVLPSRNLAVSAAVVVSSFYFIVINVLAGLPDVWGYERIDEVIIPPDATLMALFHIVVPVVVPAIISLILLRLCVNIVTSD
ncbi:MAG: hypothetical protein ACPG7F_18840 [Aggregatilineales bacterium]